MYIEYYNNSIEYKDIDFKNEIDNILKYPISGILGNLYLIKYIKKNHKAISTKLGLLIDYPLSFNSIEHRALLTQQAIDTGCDFIVLPIPFYYIINRKYDKFRSELKYIYELCSKNNIEIRYMLEYRKFDHQLLIKVCKMLIENNIDIVYLSTGFFVDNIEDHLIASNYLRQKTGIKTIINANIWKADQISSIYKNNLHGISINNHECLKIINPQFYDNKKR